MIIYLACASVFIAVGGILLFMICAGRKTAYEQQAEDEAQMAYLTEWEAMRALERDLFAAE
jgi:hypothetical protein